MKILASLAVIGLAFLFTPAAALACNNPPTANTDVYNMAKNTILSIYHSTLKANDTDPEGDPLSAYVSGPPTTGSFCGIAPDGVCYQPPTNFTGLVAIPYSLSDGCNTVGGTVLVNVQ
jgi:hypothetical protein